jgi:uncharacterized circularly permuted ATP-grasp superfamily protein
MNDAPAFDEMTPAHGGVRRSYQGLSEWLSHIQASQLEAKRLEADLLFRRLGITFAVYGAGADPERLIPFDVIPRILSQEEWSGLSRGLVQRVKALNLFLRDIYHEAEIVRAGRIPADLVTAILVG